MKTTHQIIKSFSLSILFFISLCAQSLSVNAGQSTQEDNITAFQYYQNSAHMGDANAQLQLATFYANGIGVESDSAMAIIYICLAEDHGNKKAKSILSSLENEEEAKANCRNSSTLKKYGHNVLSKNIYPNMLDEKISLNSVRRVSSASKVSNSSYNTVRKSILSSAIINFDVAADGRVRDAEIEKNFYTSRRAIESMIEETSQVKYRPASIQGNKNNKVRSFGHRSVWANRELTEYYIKKKQPRFYKKVKTLQIAAQNNEPYAQYELAMLTLVFPALELNTIGYVKNIELAAKAGLPEAQIEYAQLLLLGMKVQKNSAQAIDYLLSAAQAGNARAQYKLARQFLAGTVIKKNEHKALFWLKQSEAQQDPYAKFWLARLSLISDDKSLRKPELAKELLEAVEKQEENNPNWYYFSALAEWQLGDIEESLDLLSDAIELAEDFSWDISKFKKLSAELEAKTDV